MLKGKGRHADSEATCQEHRCLILGHILEIMTKLSLVPAKMTSSDYPKDPYHDDRKGGIFAEISVDTKIQQR